jgi:hypothetical protein
MHKKLSRTKNLSQSIHFLPNITNKKDLVEEIKKIQYGIHMINKGDLDSPIGETRTDINTPSIYKTAFQLSSPMSKKSKS